MNSKRKRTQGGPEKRRDIVFQFDMGEAVASNFTFDGNSLEFRNQAGERVVPQSGTVSNQYERPKGPKILSSSPLAMHAPIRLSPDYALMEYDVVMAVDANTRTIKGVEVSVAAVVIGLWNKTDPHVPILDLGPSQAIEYRNTRCHPDLLAWVQLLKGVGYNKDFKKEGGLALIVDSHLGDLARIRNREQPILDQFFLPEWASIFFASDVAADGMTNKALRMADKYSADLLSQLERYSTLPMKDLGHSNYCEYMHIWTYTG